MVPARSRLTQTAPVDADEPAAHMDRSSQPWRSFDARTADLRRRIDEATPLIRSPIARTMTILWLPR